MLESFVPLKYPNPIPANAKNPSQYPKRYPKANSSPISAISSYFINISIQYSCPLT